jgi:hypothetical protein
VLTCAHAVDLFLDEFPGLGARGFAGALVGLGTVDGFLFSGLDVGLNLCSNSCAARKTSRAASARTAYGYRKDRRFVPGHPGEAA